MQKYDFFISYNHADKRWAEWIASELCQAGRSVHLQEWHFRSGPPIVDQIDEALASAGCTLSVLSPDYFPSEWCKLEWQAALTRETKREPHRLLLVQVRDCELPPLLSARANVPLTGEDDAEDRRRLLDAA